MRASLATVFVLALSFSSFAAADEVLFNNGDHLTGKIETLDGEKLTITSAVAGKITVNLKDIKTFSTTAPIEIHLSDGTVLHQRVVADADGHFAIAPGGAVQAQAFEVKSIAQVNPPPEAWHGNLVAGGFIARGNTDTDSFNMTAHAVRRNDFDRLTLDAGYLYTRDRPAGATEKRRTADDWFFEGKYDRFFTKKFYGYGDIRVERDLIANLSLRLTPGAGVGYQWFENPKDLSFNTEGGVSWIYRSYRNDGSNDTVALRGAYHLVKKFNDKISVFHDFEIYPGLDALRNFYLVTDVGIHAALTEKFFTEFKIVLKHDNNPAPNTQDDDVRYIAGLGWQF